MLIILRKAILLFLLQFVNFHLSAATFISDRTGDWNDPTTWVEGSIPTTSDDIIIDATHVVTISGSAYTHTGNLTINAGGELIADTGDSAGGFIFKGGEFHVFGDLTFTFPDKDLIIEGNSLFWGHPSAIIFVSDDWIVKDNAQTIVEGICVEVDDDFHIDGPNTTVCGGGGVSIGNDSGSNTFNLLNGANANQICLRTVVYRGVGGACTTQVTAGTGTEEPTAVDDSDATNQDTATTVDVLDMGIPDSDPDVGDVLQIVSTGYNGEINDGTTENGGTVSINDNGTPLITSDDVIDYTPPAGFYGIDEFRYIITDQNGALDYATVLITVSQALPVSLVDFYGNENDCQMVLNWLTESEQNNDYFEIEKSKDGRDFETIGKESGAGNSSTFQHYKFVDPIPSSGNYYRLKQVDFDGAYSYSPVIHLTSDCITNDDNIGIITLFPNPVLNGEVSIRFKANESETNEVVLYNLVGHRLKSHTLTLKKGMNDVRMDVSEITAGTYWLRLGKRTTSFIKSRD